MPEGEHTHPDVQQLPGDVTNVVTPVVHPALESELVAPVLGHEQKITALESQLKEVDERLARRIEQAQSELRTLIQNGGSTERIDALETRFNNMLKLGEQEVQQAPATVASVPEVVVAPPEQVATRTVRRFGGRKVARPA